MRMLRRGLFLRGLSRVSASPFGSFSPAHLSNRSLRRRSMAQFPGLHLQVPTALLYGHLGEVSSDRRRSPSILQEPAEMFKVIR